MMLFRKACELELRAVRCIKQGEDVLRYRLSISTRLAFSACQDKTGGGLRAEAGEEGGGGGANHQAVVRLALSACQELMIM